MDRYDEMKKYLNIIREQISDNKINVAQDIENKIEDDTGNDFTKKKYRISGNILVLNGKSNKDVNITDLEKNAFSESIREFRDEVSEITNFNELNIYPDNVEWSGNIPEYNINFLFTIGEQFGVYLYPNKEENNLNLFKIDDESYKFLESLKTYYSKFKAKWSDVLAARKQM